MDSCIFSKNKRGVYQQFLYLFHVNPFSKSLILRHPIKKKWRLSVPKDPRISVEEFEAAIRFGILRGLFIWLYDPSAKRDQFSWSFWMIRKLLRVLSRWFVGKPFLRRQITQKPGTSREECRFFFIISYRIFVIDGYTIKKICPYFKQTKRLEKTPP